MSAAPAPIAPKAPQNGAGRAPAAPAGPSGPSAASRAATAAGGAASGRMDVIVPLSLLALFVLLASGSLTRYRDWVRGLAGGTASSASSSTPTAATVGAGGSSSSLVAAAQKAGFSGDQLVTAVAVALAESGGNPQAVGDQGTSYGLWQIHLPAHPGITAAQAQDPTQGAAAAFAISKGGTNWSPWSTYTNGAYTSYLDRARQLISGG